MSKYSVLKLTSGQDIIGKKLPTDLDTVDVCVRLQKPMVMLSTTVDNGATIVFLRSYALMAKNKEILIQNSQIITEYEPEKVLVDYYITMIEYNQKFIEDDLIKGMKSASLVIKEVIDTGNISSKSKDPYEKSVEYWESLMKSSKKH
jgi:hypothetical protein